jgi:hypothetical protein
MRATSTISFGLLALTLGAGTALAQSSPAGSPADPNSVENRQPGPSGTMPADPAAGSNPSAREPTAPLEGSLDDQPATDGASSGEMGSATSPAGIPADPNSNENRQPGPSATKPTDPAAGSKPAAREPTAPAQ